MANIDDMLSFIERLSSSSRFAGSKGSSDSRELIISHLTGAGYKYDLHHTTVPKWSIDRAPVIEFLTPQKMIVSGIPAIFSSPTPPEGIKGKIIRSGTLTMLESFDWERYAIISENGVISGYLISTSYGAQMQPLPKDAEKLPYVILDSDTLEKMKRWIESGQDVAIHVKNPTVIEGSSGLVNIITEEPEKKPYALVCAHYDTVFGTKGAHDNASGVAVALELAKKNIPCRFAFFDGEELNKAGSYAFVTELKKNGILKDISFVLEIDAVGAGDEIALLCSQELNKKLQKLKEQVLKKCITNCKVSISRQQKIGFSDVWPFMQEGIPVVRMLARGDAGKNIMHADNDTIDKIDSNTLSAAYEIAFAVAQLEVR